MPMDSNVVILDCVTNLPIPPDRVLESAIGQVSEVVVIGYDHDGELYIASSHGKKPELLWMLEQVRNVLVTGGLSDRRGN